MPVPQGRNVHRRGLLRDDVHGSIRDAIIRGELAPGEQLRDAELSEWLGVSRTPIREALLRLRSAGLVCTSPGRATVVAPEDPDAVRQARQVAAELHALAARLAAPLLTADHLEQMTRANDAMQEATANGDAAAALEADQEFHAIVVAGSGLPLIGSLLDEITPTLHRTEYLHFRSHSGASSAQLHREIIEALRVGDAVAAAEATRTNWLTLPGR